jgi:hypothetical protein
MHALAAGGCCLCADASLLFLLLVVPVAIIILSIVVIVTITRIILTRTRMFNVSADVAGHGCGPLPWSLNARRLRVGNPGATSLAGVQKKEKWCATDWFSPG